VLRLGAYQILGMRVPAHAAVSESVELARATDARGAVAFVNALLRRLAREGPPTPIDPGRFPLAWLGTEGSLPAWLAERWLRQLGPGPAVARARAFLDHAPAAFRLNPRVADAWERVVDAGLEPEALRVPGAFRARAGRPADLVSAGVIYLQDEGSQLVAHLAAHGRLLLDACAAPGGKSTLMADLLGPAALVVATEPAPERLRSMARLVRAWGASNVACVGADALCPPFAGGFDSVLIDAPCSGLGTLARRPDIRWRFRPAQLAAQAARQRRLLLSLAALVNAGGILVYSTCSLEPEETTSVSSWFLRQDLGFEPDTLPGWAAPFRNDDLSASVLPERHGGDGFFVASFRRRGGRPW
jgi:16S rRNA (cytosine967-C5)-methyltransferase